jgi:hypothetical protein
MADPMVKPWTRIQDWVSLLAGGYLALSPLWLETDTVGMWAMIGTGAVIVVMAVIALAMPGAVIDEWTTALVGVFAFIAPWVFSFTGDTAPWQFSFTTGTAAAWTSWIVGIVVAVSALAAVPASREVYRHQHHVA